MQMSNAEQLAAYVRDARTKCGFHTQKALAAAIGVTPKTIQNIENASRTAYASATLAALDDALGWETGSSEGILSKGDKPKEATSPGGPKHVTRVVRQRMLELGISDAAKLAEAAGVPESVVDQILSGLLPKNVSDQHAVELALQWEPDAFPRLLLGYEPRKFPGDIASEAGCPITAGVAETVAAARKVAQAMSAASSFSFEPIQSLDVRSKMFAIAWLLGSQVNDFDLLNGRQYQSILRTLETSFKNEVDRMQMEDPRYATEPTPSGFTRAEIDSELSRGAADAGDAIRRLGRRLANQAFDLIPGDAVEEESLPDFTKLAARRVTNRPQYDQTHAHDTVGEENQDIENLEV
ncbi:helix-turn-helix domain-containing protein [Schaalia sp. ZJ405]|uniref:helix-turn-helix domain-containing protein n=1 Tax=Schaalia sp. ZJ405 TaxID=2709403 RepID=UPI0013ED5513|nr:helix-turn-helix transcriptional regulator [Schaalia sp. ZJ405]QPK80787.1 helix-turn-helix domain-containing protein [Schaalia sp. ZJ405]